MIILAILWRSTPVFQTFLLTNAIISLCKLSSFSLELQCKHILIMSDSDLKLNKFNILMMPVIFSVLTQLILEKLLVQVESTTFLWSDLN